MIASHLARIVDKARLIPLMEKTELFARTFQSKGLDKPLHHQIRSISHLIPPNAVVFDVGANVGNWTRALLEQYGDHIAQVHCFEPVDVNIARIRAIGSPKVVVHPFGAGSREEEREFYSDFVGSGVGSIYNRDTPANEMTGAGALAIVRDALPIHLPDLGVVTDQRATGQLAALFACGRNIEPHRESVRSRRFRPGTPCAGNRGELRHPTQQGENSFVRSFTFEIGSVNITARTYLADFVNFARSRGFHFPRFTAGGGLYPLTSYRVSQECFATSNYLAVRA